MTTPFTSRSLLESVIGLSLVLAASVLLDGSLQPSETGTLVFVGFTKEGLVLAADSGVVGAGGVVRNDAVKILRTGQFGAALITGSTRLTYDHEDISLYEIIERCVSDSADITKAFKCTKGGITRAIPNRPLSRSVDAPHSEVMLGVYFAGFVNGAPLVRVLEFLIDSKTHLVSAKQQETTPEPGFFTGFGRSDFAKAVLNGDVAALARRPEVKLFRAREYQKKRSSYTSNEMEDLERFLLLQTETPLARAFDPLAITVRSPNHLVLIDARSGFHEIDF